MTKDLRLLKGPKTWDIHLIGGNCDPRPRTLKVRTKTWDPYDTWDLRTRTVKVVTDTLGSHDKWDPRPKTTISYQTWDPRSMIQTIPNQIPHCKMTFYFCKLYITLWVSYFLLFFHLWSPIIIGQCLLEKPFIFNHLHSLKVYTCELTQYWNNWNSTIKIRGFVLGNS